MELQDIHDAVNHSQSQKRTTIVFLEVLTTVFRI